MLNPDEQSEREYLDARDLPFDLRCDLAQQFPLLFVCRCHAYLPFFKKNGPAGPISPNR